MAQQAPPTRGLETTLANEDVGNQTGERSTEGGADLLADLVEQRLLWSMIPDIQGKPWIMPS